MLILDCTLRDGGYYNNWNFPLELVNEYLTAMSSAGVAVVELGMRSLANKGFKGAAGYTKDSYLNSLKIPAGLTVGVMVNASELVDYKDITIPLEFLFPVNAQDSHVSLVRIACHVHEFERALEATTWLKSKGFKVGFNLMQVSERTRGEVEALAKVASQYDFDVLYFADSMGSMDPVKCKQIIDWLRRHWDGELGIHTHDNMGLALPNTLAAVEYGVTWLDATVTGMGRGPGNARTEELAIEMEKKNNRKLNLVPLMSIIRRYFQPLKNKCGWGSNPYYYLSGKYGIHPTYIQEMLSDPRFNEEDILAAIDLLKQGQGKKFNVNALDATRHLYKEGSEGVWEPSELLSNRDVLILGAGPSVSEHSAAIEEYIRIHKPVVIGLNTQSNICQKLIDIRVASHPVRILADCDQHVNLPQALVTPVSLLPKEVKVRLSGTELKDFGMEVRPDTFKCAAKRAIVPNSLVISYALAIVESGAAKNIFLAGFDGFGAGDGRTIEMQKVFNTFEAQIGRSPISITSTGYDIPTVSVYGL